MDDGAKFLAYCVETYKSAKKMTGKEVFNLFEKYGVLDYVIDCRDALHTTGAQYTIEDIDELISSRQNNRAK